MGEAGGRGRGRGRKKADGGGGRGKRRGAKKADDILDEQAIVASDGGWDGPSVAFFDYCGEGHLRTLDLISSLYSREDEGGGLEDVIKRFSSMVTFVRGWRQFCNYKPQAIRFSHDVGTTGTSDLRYGFELSQLSAASIRKVEGEPNQSKPTKACDGFVLQVGGPVWALDWCYGTQLAHESSISCEYLAVAAHPSDSPVHKVGVALSGPGFVQIWFLLSVISKQDSFSSSHNGAKTKRRPDGRKSACEDVNDNVSISSTVGKAAGVADLSGIQGNIGGLVVKTFTDTEESLPTQQLGLIRAKKKRKLKDQARTGSACADTLSSSVHLGDSKGLLLGDSSPSIDVLNGLALPKIVLCLAHDGRVAWDVKWQPCSKGNRWRMGFLAVLLGDGSMQVWEIPTPRIIKALFISSHIKDTDPRFMKLKPVFKCSNLRRGDSQSIPLTLEWSRAVPNDLLLVGCHDGTVAMWKFLPKESCEDTRPLLCFAADTLPIRAISWAPNERDANCENLVATAGHSGNIRFWDIRDPFRPLWDLHLSRGFILGMDWVNNPSCVIFSMDDGTLRILSLLKAASDVPVTGRPFSGKPCQGLQTYYCSSHAVWSVQVSQVTGMAAYCSSDGSALHFQLTSRGVEKDKRRHRTPHYLCGSLTEDTDALTLIIPKMGTASPMKRVLDESGKTPRPLRVSLSDLTHAITANPLSSDAVLDSVDELPLVSQKNAKSRVWRSSQNKQGTGETDTIDDDDGQDLQMVVTGLKESPIAAEVFPPKVVSMNRVRWNPNRGSEKWLCYGGAAGIIRCQEISMPIPER